MAAHIITKLVLLGDGTVGKTSLRRSYMGEVFEFKHLMTIGADFALKDMKVGKDRLKFQIWDVAGQETFKSIRSGFLLNTMGILMLFDLTNPSSLKSIPSWLKEVFDVNNRTDIPIIVIGNKRDLENERQIDENEIQELLNNIKQQYPDLKILDYIETSAKTGVNVSKAFDLMSKEIINDLGLTSS